MMQFRNVEGNVLLVLDVVEYQFPAHLKDDWLNLRAAVTQGDRVFERVDPAIEAPDLSHLREWFTALSQRKLPGYAQLNFIEPCLSFEFLACTPEAVRISIELKLELRPDFLLVQFGRRYRRWNIVAELNDRDFDGIIEGIARTQAHFPVRSEKRVAQGSRPKS
jgi:hypothetical protein